MKKILSLLVAIMVAGVMFSGCATDGIYAKTKTVYTAGKTIVKTTGIESTTLKAVDTTATSYNTIRETVRGEK